MNIVASRGASIAPSPMKQEMPKHPTTTITVTASKEPQKVPQNTQTLGNISLADGLSLYRHLSEKGFLCTKCTVGLAQGAYQYGQHCSNCMKTGIPEGHPGFKYQPVKVNAVDRLLYQIYRTWAARELSDAAVGFPGGGPT